MRNEDFEKLYANKDLRNRVRKLARRYFASYANKLSAIGYYDSEELVQELWAFAVESSTVEPLLLFHEMKRDVFDILRQADRERSSEFADIMAYSLEDEEGESEDEDEAMGRLIYEGRAVKVG